MYLFEGISDYQKMHLRLQLQTAADHAFSHSCRVSPMGMIFIPCYKGMSCFLFFYVKCCDTIFLEDIISNFHGSIETSSYTIFHGVMYLRLVIEESMSVATESFAFMLELQFHLYYMHVVDQA